MVHPADPNRNFPDRDPQFGRDPTYLESERTYVERSGGANAALIILAIVAALGLAAWFGGMFDARNTSVTENVSPPAIEQPVPQANPPAPAPEPAPAPQAQEPAQTQPPQPQP